MGIFFEVLSAINNPQQEASVQQLGEITQSVQRLTQQNGLQPDAMQSVMSQLGPMLGPLMQQKMGGGGAGNMLGGLMSMATGGDSGLGALTAMITPQMLQAVGQQSGVNSNVLQNLIPSLLPVVMNIMKMGNSTGGGGNTILNAFLEGGNGADLGTMLKFAHRFMNPPT